MAALLENNPNAAVGGAGGGAGIGTLATWLLNKYAGAGLSPEAGAAVAGGFATLVLFIGRAGLRGALRLLWKGKG